MKEESKKWKSCIKLIGICLVFLVGLLSLGLSIYNIPKVKARFPWFDNQYQAWQYERLAKRFPEGDYATKRYQAMADAVRHGSHDYHFETGPVPVGK